ncbi:hypothetical protein OKW76_11415 [Sphingomonas sp. S1-29]|uniref:hypothetical protein n=1 Tax=Sphingomonas sp. S1-29 TaxID=2991074 RepID=UPI00223F9859|nr:hypothetical protein [Sphingomonas sp. S1-29]UZK68652.1 hypothetical protein OKW76_11415 [Sphingomonas sp. S1-29]
MPDFAQIDEVAPSPQFGNCGPAGWTFSLWGSPRCAAEVHRQLIEAVAAKYPDTCLKLPAWQMGEDCIEGDMKWATVPISIWFETTLNFTSFWSADQAAILGLRAAVLPLAKKA